MLLHCISQHNWMSCSFWVSGTRVFCFILLYERLWSFSFHPLSFWSCIIQYLELVLRFPPVHFDRLFYLVLLIPVLRFQSTLPSLLYIILVYGGHHGSALTKALDVEWVVSRIVRHGSRYLLGIYNRELLFDKLYVWARRWTSQKASWSPCVCHCIIQLLIVHDDTGMRAILCTDCISVKHSPNKKSGLEAWSALLKLQLMWLAKLSLSMCTMA